MCTSFRILLKFSLWFLPEKNSVFFLTDFMSPDSNGMILTVFLQFRFVLIRFLSATP